MSISEALNTSDTSNIEKKNLRTLPSIFNLFLDTGVKLSSSRYKNEGDVHVTEKTRKERKETKESSA
jgi:hypothetical protein